MGIWSIARICPLREAFAERQARWNRDGTADDSRSGQLDGIVSGDRDLLRDGVRALDRDDAMRGVPRTQLDRSDLMARGAVVWAANLVALAEALVDLNARDRRNRHLFTGLH